MHEYVLATAPSLQYKIFIYCIPVDHMIKYHFLTKQPAMPQSDQVKEGKRYDFFPGHQQNVQSRKA